MNKRKTLLLVAAISACVGCCALPIYALATGVISLGTLGALISPGLVEMLICLIPLILIAGYLLYQRHQQKRCCVAPENKCSESQCEVEPKL